MFHNQFLLLPKNILKASFNNNHLLLKKFTSDTLFLLQLLQYNFS